VSPPCEPAFEIQQQAAEIPAGPHRCDETSYVQNQIGLAHPAISEQVNGHYPEEYTKSIAAILRQYPLPVALRNVGACRKSVPV
jgi:hypothetical protein